MPHTLHLGNCLDILRTMPDNSVDAVVTDPPYGLSFMGKRWDYDVPSQDIWSECLRVLKPGGHLLAFAGTRTQHRMAVRIEDAGFEIRDMIAWVYGSGFPKSLDVSKAIDKAAGKEREVLGVVGKSGSVRNSMAGDFAGGEYMATAPATAEARQWHGWGTALKPALEPITVARKPLIGTVAENVLTWGTGGVNVDGCRVEFDMTKADQKNFSPKAGVSRHNANKSDHLQGLKHITNAAEKQAAHKKTTTLGRWPANLIHDGSEEVVGLFPQSDGGAFPKKSNIPTGRHYEGGWGAVNNDSRKEMGEGSAARFFYCAKASKRDRDEGCEGMEVKRCSDGRKSGLSSGMPDKALAPSANHHPTVKPTDLMRYLCRLVTPPDGTVLDPFMGSGSTGKAAVLEGFNFIGIEREAEYLEIARARITHAQEQKDSKLL